MSAPHLSTPWETGTLRSQIAQGDLPRSNLRRVTTRFFGKSVKTCKMVARLPILRVLWIFTLVLVPAGSCGRSTGAADAPPVAISSKKSRPAPAIGRAEPASPPGARIDPAAQSEAREILETALQMLEGRSSVSAKISLEGELFDKHLVGQGVYFEQRSGPDYRMRLELRMQHGNQTSSLVQVCDGESLWERRNLLGEEQRSRVDVARATQALEHAEGLRGQGNMGILPGLGGLTRLLRGMAASCDFTSAQKGILKVGSDQRPVWRLQGQWKLDQLARISDLKKAMDEGKTPDLKKLPPHLFDHIVLMLRQGDLFPYRIEYRRALGDGEKAVRSGDPESRALMTVHLHDVVINAEIDASRFHYNPGDLDYPDRTAEFLKSLGVDL